MVDQGHGDVGGGAAVVSVGGEGLGRGLYRLVRVVGVEVGGHVRDLGASGHAGGRGDRGEAALELLLHDAGQRVDITEGEVANGAVLKAEKENV